MTSLVLAALVLLATHFGLASTPLRGWLVARLGAGPYLGLYSLIALGAITWLSMAWEPGPEFLDAPLLKWLPLAAMPLALWLVLDGQLGPNPASVGQEAGTGAAAKAVGVRKITRHPVLWGIGLWAAVHLAANPDLPSWVLFGTFAGLALVGTMLQDTRRARSGDPGWAEYAAVTSNLPFAAVAAGRQDLRLGRRSWLMFALALLVWVLLVGLHPWVFAMPAHPV